MFPSGSGDGTRRVLRVGVLSPVSHLGSIETQEFVSSMVHYNLFERPYAPPAGGGAPEPVLFDGPLTREPGGGAFGLLSGALRPGIVFSDGTPMTPQHVVSALSRSGSLADQASVSLRDGRIAFQLKRPNPRFDLVLSQMYCSVGIDRPGGPIGSGPFTVAPDATPDRMHLVKNARYRGTVLVDDLWFICYPPTGDHRPERLLRALDDGLVDFSNVLSRDDVSRLKNVRKTFQPGASTAILYFNTEHASLREAAVRRALAMAINRDEIARASYSNALAFTAASVLPPALESAQGSVRHNPDRAHDELVRLGASFPPRMRLLQVWGPRPYLPHPRPVSDLIVKQLRALGLTIDVVETRDSAEFYEVVARGDYDFALAGWIADTSDPADFLEALLSSELVPEPNRVLTTRSNLSRLRSPVIDAALKRHRDSPTIDNRAAVLALAHSEAPFVPLMYGPTIYVNSRRVRNFTPPAIGFPNFAQIEIVD